VTKPKFPIEIKRGSARVKIYFTPSKGCDSYTLSYWFNGQRKRQTFSDLSNAKQEAERMANRLTKGDLDVLTLSSADRASYLRARNLLDPLGVALEMAAADYEQARKALGEIPLSEAVEFYLKRHRIALQARPTKDVITEMLTKKAADGLNQAYLNHLRYDLNKFSLAFSCPIGSITGAEIDFWLRSLTVAPRTRNNLRTSVQTLFSYAKACRYIPKDHDELDSVPIAKKNGGDIEIFTPAELSTCFEFANRHLIPFLALGAFAGVRHAEIQRLDWVDIKFDHDIIEITARKAKTAARRTIPILPCLKEWLLPYRKTTGSICTRNNLSDEITNLTKRINESATSKKASPKFCWKRNGLRHSFISYRVAQTQNVTQVALEAGNSASVIFSNYRELVHPADAAKWFTIAPPAIAERIVPIAPSIE
jgi:integrase